MKAIADTGFLVAFLNSQDQHHAWAEGLAAQVSEPLLTCESVLTEAAYLLNSVPLVLDVLASGLVELSFNLEDNRVHVSELAARYADRQPDLCDLCVVRMSELFPDHPVITTDRRDFAIYKRNKRQAIPLILPPETSFTDAHQMQSRAVHEHIAGGRKTPVLFATAEDGHHEVKLCEAVLRSSRKRG